MQPPTPTTSPTTDPSTAETAENSEASDDPRLKSPGPASRFAEERSPTEEEEASTANPGALLELPEDEYARRILATLGEDTKPARELVEECEASRATVYRRLNDLEEHGLVQSGTEIHPDGHHRKVFEATLREVTIALEGEEIRASVTRSDRTPASDGAGASGVVADD